MAITFDVRDQFQDNKVFHTAQVINNILNSNTKGCFVAIETVMFKFEVQKNTCLALIIQITSLKQNFFLKKQSYDSISYLLQQYAKFF